MCNAARDLIEKKGMDYNRAQQKEDTLFNMKVATLLGITDTNTQSVLVRLSDKFMRFISLAKDPSVKPANAEEKIEDTVLDIINYTIYTYIMHKEYNQDPEWLRLMESNEEMMK